MGIVAFPQIASALSFAPSPASPISVPAPNDVVNDAATGDLNGDGLADIVRVGDAMGINIYLADEDGEGFTQAAGSPIGTGSAGSSRISVHIGQFGGDAAPDLLVQNSTYPRTFETYLGNGTGVFPNTPNQIYTAPEGPNYATVFGTGSVADVNSDGWDDVVAGMNHSSFMVALGSSTGQLTTAPGSPIQVPTGATAGGAFSTTAIGDYDGDGDEDIALGLDDSNNSSPRVFVANGVGDGVFTPDGTAVRTQGPYEWPNSLATIELDGGAYDDLAIATANARNVVTLVGSENGLVANPAAAGTIDFPNGYPYAATVADFDGDGLEDLGIADRSWHSVAVLLSDGEGNLAGASGSPFALPAVGGKDFAPNTLSSGDVNGDGAPDLVSTSSHSGDPNQARGIDVLVSQPAADVSPTSLDFPTTQKDQTSAPQSVTVENTGAVPVDLESIEKSGTDPGQFDVPGTDCPSAIEPGTSCSIGVRYAPTSHGTATASLDVTLSGVGTTSVSLSGKTPPYMDYVPPGGLSFGEVTSGYAPAWKTETVVIYSGGGSPLQLGAPSLSGPDAADFQIENPTACLDPIQFGDHCALDVTFRPAPEAGGFREAELDFASNNDPQFTGPIALGGYARRAELAVEPASGEFGEAKIGPAITRTPKVFTIKSVGPAAVPFSGVDVTGPNADSFLITGNDCPELIPADVGTCKISVVFDPKYGEASQRSATLEVDAFTSTGPNPTTVQLTGTATSDPIPPPPVKKPKLTLKLKSPAKVKRGKALVVTAIVKNTGNGPAKPLTIRATVPKKLAKAPKAIKVRSLAPGRSVTKKFRIKTKRFKGKRPKNLKVKVVAASGNVKRVAAKRVKLR